MDSDSDGVLILIFCYGFLIGWILIGWTLVGFWIQICWILDLDWLVWVGVIVVVWWVVFGHCGSVIGGGWFDYVTQRRWVV